MLTTNRYINLIVFHILNQCWSDNNLTYILEKYHLLFDKFPDKIKLDEINRDVKFMALLDNYKERWKIKELSEDYIKLFYFCYFMDCQQPINNLNYSIYCFNFYWFTLMFDKFFNSYDSITSRKMLFLLHENLRIEITKFLDREENDEKFKNLYIRAKLTKYKQNV